MANAGKYRPKKARGKQHDIRPASLLRIADNLFKKADHYEKSTDDSGITIAVVLTIIGGAFKEEAKYARRLR